MAVFAYRGINPAGKAVRGVKDADSPKTLRALLRRDGILVTEVLQEGEKSKKGGSREIDVAKFFRRVSSLDIAIATRQLATLLKSGIPLVEALTALIDQLEQPDLKLAFTQTRDKVNEGTSLAESLKAHAKIFPPLYVNMVQAGEASGTLDAVLGRLAEFLEAQTKLTNKVTAALAYPAFMILMGISVISTMMIVVVPKITAIFESFQAALPWYTQTLIFISNIFTNYWWLLILVVSGSTYGFRRWRATEKGRGQWDAFVLKTPLFGKLAVMIAVSRFARTLSTLLASGVPLLGAMEITRNVLGNMELMKVIDDARASIREGESIAAPLKRSGKFPPIVTHMIAIGERSGQLEEMLENVASAYDTQVESRLQLMTSLMEPILIVVLGGVSGGIAFSVMMPLLQINDFVN